MTMTSINDRIDQLVIEGTLTGQDTRDVQLLIECAERYITGEYRRRARTANRDVERSTKIRVDAAVRLREKIEVVVADLVTSLHAQWDGALLASTFSIGSGDRVAWCDATPDQHLERAILLEGMAAGDLQTASIHRQAARDIQSAGVATLAGLAS